MLAVLAAVNYYVLYVRHGTSVPALLKAAEVGRMNSTVPGLSGPPGTPPQVAARVRKPSGREGLPVSYSRALDVALRDEDCEPDALAAALRQRGVAEKLSRTIEETLQQAVQAADIEARPDDTAGLSLYYDQEDLLLSVDYRRSRALAFHLERTTAGSAEVWTAARLTRPLTVQTAVISGILTQEGGLADALQRAGETEGLVGPIADVFGYELDLPAESRSGDRFQVVVEKHLLGGAFYRYGRLLAVQYQGRGGALRAYRFVVPGASSAFRFDPEAGYYNERGESLARSWLRSPVRLGSRGALLLGLDRRRPWPVAHLERRALLGMDYSAPAGTVVRAVASGKVLARSARPAAAGGVTLTVAHGGTEATYGHLGRLARGLVDGAAVRPGQSQRHLDAGVVQAVLHAAVQRGGEHPLARAVVQAAAARSDVTVEAASDVRAIPGRGTEGHIADTALLIGSLRWMQEMGADLSQAATLAESLQSAGATVSAVATRDPAAGSAPRIVGLLAFGDEPKPGAAEALSRLRASGLRVCMISGDNRGAALAMAARLGLTADEVMAEVLPSDKAARVAALREGGHVVAMVGDGVNDAPALAAADVGIAMGTGTDVAMHAAAITLMRGDIALVADALDISRRTVAKIRQNLFWAFAYNVAGIPLAAFGYLNPVVAGAAMAMSSVSVMTNALLLSRWKGR